MNLKIPFVLIAGIILVACSNRNEPPSNSNQILNEASASIPKGDTSWKTYSGILPCADCPGIKTELSIKDNFTIESYQFVLKETYLEAENGKDKSFESKGMYNFWRGNSSDPDATIIVLNDDSVERAKRFFLRVSDKELKSVDHKGDEIDSQMNFSLMRTK